MTKTSFLAASFTAPHSTKRKRRTISNYIPLAATATACAARAMRRHGPNMRWTGCIRLEFDSWRMPITSRKTKLWVISAASLAASHLFGNPPYALTVGDGFVDPLGFYDSTPKYSWKLPNGARKQTAYHIEAKTGGKLWDSGWVESDQSTFVRYGGEPLASRQRLEWRVSFRDENGKDSGWSEPAHLELGLLSANDWKAQWIRPNAQSDASREAVALLRRSFTVAKKIAHARVYVTAHGVFELYLNGARVGNDHFANGWTDYHKRLDTLIYDVTNQLSKGNNTAEAMLGDGWYAGRLTWEKGTK